MESIPARQLTLRDLLLIYRRRRKVVYVTCLFVISLVAFYCVICTRRYQASGVIELQKESADSMGLGTLMSSASGGATDALSVNVDLQTQADILQSDTLALRTIEHLDMEHTKDFQRHRNPIGAILSLLTPHGTQDSSDASLENSPRRRQRALEIFHKHLKIKIQSGSRLIEIDYSAPDPKLAATVVNSLMKGLADYSFQTRFDATNQASKWLTNQLGDLRKSSENLQAKVVKLQRESGVYSLGTADAQGREQAYSGVLDRLQQDTQVLTAAQQNRILKEAIARAAETGNAEMLSSLAGNTGAAGGAGGNSLATLQTLRQQEASERASLQEAETKFGPNYPKVLELKGNLAGMQRSINDEIGRIKGRAESDYKIAVQAEARTHAEYDKAKKQADILNDKAIEYTIAKEEAEQSRVLYEDLLKRLNEAGVLEGLHSSNITIVDPGRAPAIPSTPNIPLYLFGAIFGGLLLGFCLAFLTDALDSKLHSISELEEITGQNILGATPHYLPGAPDSAPVAIREPQSTFTEAMRTIRTSILLTRGDKPPKVVLVTSSIASEGKTTFSTNLAIVLALQGQRVLIVDTDLRRGTLFKQLNLKKSDGLSALLSGQITEPTMQEVPGVPRLFAIEGGLVPPNPSELLGSASMKLWLDRWRDQFDVVVLDSTPVLPVTDATILQGLADLTILLTRANFTERHQAQRSYFRLSQHAERYVGVVINDIDPNDEGYYGYYGYYGYRREAYAGKEER